MKKTIVKYLFLSLLLFNCINKNNREQIRFNPNRDININYSQDTVSIFDKIDRLKDSLNQNKNHIPGFLSDILLDSEYPFVTDHGIFSTREILISSINDKALLKKIIKDKKYHKKLSKKDIIKYNLKNVPFLKQSIADLAQIRLKKIENDSL